MNSVDMEASAQEMAMHIAMCVCTDYINSWGLGEFLEKLEGYSNDELLPIVKAYALELEEKT